MHFHSKQFSGIQISWTLKETYQIFPEHKNVFSLISSLKFNIFSKILQGMVYPWKSIWWISLADTVHVKLGISQVFYGFLWVNIMLSRNSFSTRCFSRIPWISLGDSVHTISEVLTDKLFPRSFMDFNGRHISRYSQGPSQKEFPRNLEDFTG